MKFPFRVVLVSDDENFNGLFNINFKNLDYELYICQPFDFTVEQEYEPDIFIFYIPDQKNILFNKLSVLQENPLLERSLVLVISPLNFDEFQVTHKDSFIFISPDHANFENQILALIRFKKNEKLHLRGREQSEKTICNLSSGIWDWDIITNTINLNPYFYQMIGYDPDDFDCSFDTLKINIHPQDWNELYSLITQFILGKISHYRKEYRFQHKSGSWIWLSSQDILLEKNDNGEPVRFVCSQMDISQQKYAQADLEKTESFYRSLIEKAPDGVVTLTESGDFLFTSPAAKRIFGYLPDEKLNHPDELTHPEDLQMVHQAFQQLLNDPSYIPVLEYRSQHKNGNWIWIESTFSNFLTDPAIQAIVINFRDITERKQAENALKESTRKLDTLINNLRGVAYRSKNNKNWTMEFISKGIYELTGYPYQDFLNNKTRSFNDIIHPDDRQSIWDKIQKAIKTKSTFTLEYRILHADGTIRWVLEYGSSVYKQGRVVALEGFITDITKHKLSEQSLITSQERWRSYVENAPLGIFIVDDKGNFLDVNPEACQQTGYSSAELCRMQTTSTIPKSWHEQANEHFNQVSSKTRAGIELPFITKTGEKRWWQVTGVKLSNDRMLGFTADITDSKLYEIDIANKNNMLSLLNQISIEFSEINTTDDIYALIAAKIKHLSGALAATLAIYNPVEHTLTPRQIKTASSLLNRLNQLLGKDITQITSSISQETYQKMVSGAIDVSKSLNEVTFGAIPKRLCNIIQKTLKIDHFIGVAYIIDGQLFGTSVLAMKKDQENPSFEFLRTFSYMAALALRRKRVEEENIKLQEQLLQAQKMESIGRLAGGVAHDFNNMLQAILGHTELALEFQDSLGDAKENLEEIQKAARRSADLTRQLLTFARKQAVMPKVLDLNQTITGMLNMLRRVIGEDIQLDWLPGKKLWAVYIDPIQIDQILANLCINARDAISGNGNVSIATCNISFDNNFCLKNQNFQPGEYVQISVSDNGYGMDTNVQKHLFEPFFTTKKIGQGTGLGLATVYGIIKQNNGFIHVSSTIKQGSIFKIFFPRYEGDTVTEKKTVILPNYFAQNKSILLVEDERSILDMTQLMLEKIGYTVYAANSPSQAIQIAETSIQHIDILVTDVVMPEMNGKELYDHLIAKKANLECLFMSGYPYNAITQHGISDVNKHYIQKPFSMNQLAQVLKKMLV